MPTNILRSSYFFTYKGFVLTSDRFRSVLILISCILYFSKTSRIQWNRTLICFVHEWNVAFLLKSMTNWLSQWRIYISWFNDNSLTNFFIYKSSLLAFIPFMYLSSVVDITTHVRNLNYHYTTPPWKVNIYL